MEKINWTPPFDDQLRKAVTEYYEYQGDSDATPIRYVLNKKSRNYYMLLVRFTDNQGKEPEKMSALMDYDHWKDGHWDVTEMFVSERESEDELIKEFENSQDYL